MNNRERQQQYQEKYKRKFPHRWFRYCIEPLENIENWDKMLEDTSDTRWNLHHIAEIQGDIIVRKDELKSRGEYYNLPANKLIFLTEFDHKSLHNSGANHPMFGRNGDKNPMFGKTGADHPKSKRIEIYGIVYESIRAAANAFKKNKRTIWRWLKNGRAKYI